MAKTGHYECEICGELKDPRGKGWERQASDVYIKISGSMPQLDYKLPTVCHECAQAVNDAIQETMKRLKPVTCNCTAMALSGNGPMMQDCPNPKCQYYSRPAQSQKGGGE